MQMQQMRAGRAPQVPVPPANAAPLKVSREMQQQLRQVRHSAFERHQENAQWTKELLEGSNRQNESVRTASDLAASQEELQKRIEDKEKSTDELEQQLVQQEQAQQAAQRRFEEILAALKAAGDAAALKECEEKLEENESKLLEPYAYISELPGKNVRGRMISAFQSWLRAPADAVESIQSIVDELHNASLLIDDIEDDSEMRRGQPVAHHIFGVPATINCANYVYFLSLQKCQALGNPRALQVYTDEMLRLHQGQGLDIFWRDHLQCPTVDEYLEMTGGLFRLAVGLMQAFSDCTMDFTPLVNALAVYFQVRDDYVNLLDEAYMENKSFCEDLTEGKFSFPLIVAIRENPQDTRLLSILKQRTKSIHLKQYAVQYLRETGAVNLTLSKLNSTVEEIRSEIALLGGNPALEQIVDGLHATIK
ncbi:hypothetical protein F442_09311 [Phytophthora nicotianae P10297]|uniref:Geranylgeranyl pyrophosphate synthase n=2 Tax=Phytophthora nicotianae TaxID=4792 RepID=W2Q5T4_PHYN3|nr:hypothetical protein PPTG_23034 [Phytophthora nicotianae INRA-310]ETN08553.1 hypothetical protein PPTG_23034 [Phytophthora nicotianae INRA-310]ETP44067.1 hypothetical protein F442_09311 [Phytophthora nicotianae P10297]